MKSDKREWLLTSFDGSFAMGSLDRVPRRKYHGLWISRLLGGGVPEHLLLDVYDGFVMPGLGEHALVNFDFGEGAGFDARSLLESFDNSGIPTWCYRLPGDFGSLTRTFEFLPPVLSENSPEGIQLCYRRGLSSASLDLVLEPFFTIRDLHKMNSENLALDGSLELTSEKGEKSSSRFLFRPYQGYSFSLGAVGDCRFSVNGHWVRNFSYSEEISRGYPAQEDCFSPGRFTFKVPSAGSISFTVRLIERGEAARSKKQNNSAEKTGALAQIAGDSGKLAGLLARALQQFVYFDSRLGAENLIAGFPWFSAWARDAFVSLPGLSLAWDDPNRAMKILDAWAPRLESSLFSRASGPADDLNCSGLDTPFHWAKALEFLCERHPKRALLDREMEARLLEKLEKWVLLFFENECSFAQVTDMGLRCQTSASAHPASSWMDAVVERAAITPRQGYPVDINALFFDSLGFLTRRSKSSKAGTKRLLEQYLADVPQKFALSFWVAERQFVADGHDGFRQDAALRPNQLWLLASSFNPFSAEQSRSAIQRIRSELLTSYGLRSLSPLDSRYRGSCKGTQTERDLSYHQGTVWPWLAGVFFEASLKYFPRAEVAAWMQPLTQAFLEHLNLGCVGQISEIFDGDFPHEPRGAPAQAWSAAELLRTVWMIET